MNASESFQREPRGDLVFTPKALYSTAQGQHAVACATLGNIARAQATGAVRRANAIRSPAKVAQGGARYRVLTLGYRIQRLRRKELHPLKARSWSRLIHSTSPFPKLFEISPNTGV